MLILELLQTSLTYLPKVVQCRFSGGPLDRPMYSGQLRLEIVISCRVKNVL